MKGREVQVEARKAGEPQDMNQWKEGPLKCIILALRRLFSTVENGGKPFLTCSRGHSQNSPSTVLGKYQGELWSLNLSNY